MYEKDIALALREPTSSGEENRISKYNTEYLENSKNQQEQGQIIHTLGNCPRESVI